LQLVHIKIILNTLENALLYLQTSKLVFQHHMVDI